MNYIVAEDPDPVFANETKLDEPPDGLTKEHDENEQVVIGKLKNWVIRAVLTI